MKAPVVSAWIAAGLLAASGARAQQADCDMMCRLQGYLTSDHMAAAPDGAPVPAGAGGAKHHPHAATKPASAKTVVTAKKADEPPRRAASAKPPRDAGVRSVAASPVGHLSKAVPPLAVAVAAAEKPSRAATSTPPRPPERAASPVPSPAPRVASATEARPLPETHLHRPPRKAPRFARTSVPPSVADAALIPGSAPLVPADFQASGKL